MGLFALEAHPNIKKKIRLWETCPRPHRCHQILFIHFLLFTRQRHSKDLSIQSSFSAM